MSIERDTLGEFYVECSICEYVEEFPDAERIKEAIDAVKEAGWKITKMDGEWNHICQICQEEIMD